MSLAQSRRRQDRLTMLFPLLAVGFFAALTYWLDARVTADAAARHKAAPTAPDHFMETFVIEKTSPTGVIDQTITGVRAKHFPSNNRTELESPRYTSTMSDKPTLEVTSARGVLLNDPKKRGLEQADFSGKVVAIQGAFQGRDPIRYESETLRVFPESQRAVTSDTTKTVSGDRVMTTNGIEIDAINQTGKTSEGFTLELSPKEKK